MNAHIAVVALLKLRLTVFAPPFAFKAYHNCPFNVPLFMPVIGCQTLPWVSVMVKITLLFQPITATSKFPAVFGEPYASDPDAPFAIEESFFCTNAGAIN